MSLETLIDLVSPPTVPFEQATVSEWEMAKSVLGFSLPQDHYDLAVTYGSGLFSCSDGRYIQVMNPVSKRHRHSYANLQESYREAKQNQTQADFPYDMFPTVPGLYTIGGASSPIAFFYLIENQEVPYTIVVKTFQRQWVTFQLGLLEFLVTLLRDQDSIWAGVTGPSQGIGSPSWTFISEKPRPTMPTAQFHEAVLLGDKDQITQLVTAGVDLNGKDSSGITPLCKSDNPEVIQLLLSLGADPNVTCDDGRTPLIVALRSQAPLIIIQALLDAGANPNTHDSSGMTPLMHASKYSDLETVMALLGRGVDVNAVDNFGKTALYAARKRPSIFALLRQSGATE